MPQPRVTMGRAVEYLKEHGETQANQLAETLGVTPGTLTSAVKSGVLEGTIVKRKEGHHAFYSLGDGTPPEPPAPQMTELGDFMPSLWADGELRLQGMPEPCEDGSIILNTFQRKRLAQLLTGQL